MCADKHKNKIKKWISLYTNQILKFHKCSNLWEEFTFSHLRHDVPCMVVVDSITNHTLTSCGGMRSCTPGSSGSDINLLFGFFFFFYNWLAYASPSSAGLMVLVRCVGTEAYRSDTVDMTSVRSASPPVPSSTVSTFSLAGSAVVSKWTTSEYWTCGELRPDCVVGGFRVRLA